MRPACLPQRLRRHCRRSIVVRVEEGLGDLERAPLIVMSKDFVVLYARDTDLSPGSVVLCVCAMCVCEMCVCEMCECTNVQTGALNVPIRRRLEVGPIRAA